MKQLDAVVPQYRAAAQALQGQAHVLKEKLAAAARERAALQDEASGCCFVPAACFSWLFILEYVRFLAVQPGSLTQQPPRQALPRVLAGVRTCCSALQVGNWRGIAQKHEAAFAEAAAQLHTREAQSLAASTQVQVHVMAAY
jgi:hypothetical protein